jgi:hypothetical protein
MFNTVQMILGARANAPVTYFWHCSLQQDDEMMSRSTNKNVHARIVGEIGVLILKVVDRWINWFVTTLWSRARASVTLSGPARPEKWQMANEDKISLMKKSKKRHHRTHKQQPI